ncbi:MAG: hypothetical protein E6K63_14230 [Nitrospirae bacterium]|nr:MAG: hypothetical protein E6K63_14230 [Nitrospirota bacterium]
MPRAQCSPLLFLLTGLGWLILSAVLGLGLFLAMTLGQHVPPHYRTLHVHLSLVGGVAQLMLGVTLLSRLAYNPAHNSFPVFYAAINGATIGLLAGFWLGQPLVIGTAGLLVMLASLSLLRDVIGQTQHGALSFLPWLYGIALFALLGGLAVGEGMTLRLFSHQFIGQARLAHIHLSLIGFVTLIIVSTMYHLLPTVLKGRLHSMSLTRVTVALLPLGMLVLLAGFLLSSLWTQQAGGVIMLAGTVLYGLNLLRTWRDAGRVNNAAADHLIQAAAFLVVGIVTGMLVSINFLFDPPGVPFGNIHLIAYTHLLLVGFFLHTTFGALSHLLPTALATERVQSNKQRESYQALLTGIVERWRPVQVGALSVGTMGLAVVAALLWQFPLRSIPAQAATWISLSLLLLSFALFAGKIGLILTQRPNK